MNKKQISSALDSALASDFDDSSMPLSVPMVVPEKVEVPATLTEEQKTIKSNLYNTTEKLTAVLDYLVNNIEELSNGTNALIKTSPVADIVSVAHEIGLINDRIYKYTMPQQQTPNAKGGSYTQNNIQVNKYTKDDKSPKPIETGEFSLEKLDNMLKEGKI